MTEETKSIKEIKQDLADFKYDFEKLSKIFHEYIEASQGKNVSNKIVTEERLSEIIDEMENGD